MRPRSTWFEIGGGLRPMHFVRELRLRFGTRLSKRKVSLQRGASYVEHLVLIALLALGLIGAATMLRSAISDASKRQGDAIATLTGLDPSGELSRAPSIPILSGGGSSEPSSKGDDGWLPSPRWLLGSALHLVGDAYNAAGSLVPGRLKPLIRSINQHAIGFAIDVADKVLPDAIKDKALAAAGDGVEVLSRVLDKTPAPAPLKNFLDKLRDFDFKAFRKDEGLNGDWYRLYKVWLTESRPRDLGVWDKNAKGEDRVTITNPQYTDDLKNRPQNQDAIDNFFKQHAGSPQSGDSSTWMFEYNGPQSAEGGTYTAVESYTGSYQTKVTYLGQNPTTGQPHFRVEVSNTSHWESGTRVPESGKAITGGRDYLVPDSERGRGVGIGGDFEQVFVWEQDGSPSPESLAGKPPQKSGSNVSSEAAE